MNIEKRVRNFKTKYKAGFTQAEIDLLLNDFPEINMEKFNASLNNITVMGIKDETVFYRNDIIKALHCGIENRNLKPEEWD